MSGETEAQVSGWTVDTLREHLEIRAGDLHSAVDGRLTELRTAVDQRFADLKEALDERYSTQQEANRLAFDAAATAVQAALNSAEKAVAKAEAAADKRFESVNEFRGQLADQARQFPTKDEMTARFDSQAADILRNSSDLRALELRLTSRLDLMTGGDTATANSKEQRRLDTGQILGVIAAITAVVGIAVGIILATRH